MKNSFLDFKLFAVPEASAAAGRGQGKNRREVLVLLEAAGQKRAELQVFLGRMLGAANLDLDADVGLLFLEPEESLSLSGLQSHIPFKTVLSFGINPERLGLHLPLAKYRPTRHAGITYLFADHLKAIYEERQRGDREMAGALWAALQEVFLSTDS